MLPGCLHSISPSVCGSVMTIPLPQWIRTASEDALEVSLGPVATRAGSERVRPLCASFSLFRPTVPAPFGSWPSLFRAQVAGLQDTRNTLSRMICLSAGRRSQSPSHPLLGGSVAFEKSFAFPDDPASRAKRPADSCRESPSAVLVRAFTGFPQLCLEKPI